MASTTPVFGHGMRKHFFLKEGYTPLNHGSYGTVPRVVMDSERRLEEECENIPDMWFRSTYRMKLLDSVKAVAQFVHAPQTGSVVCVENATAAINSVFRGIQFHSGEHILHFSVAYPMVKNVIQYVSKREGAIPVVVPVVPPIHSEDEIVENVRTALAKIPAGQLRLCSYDHISSVPALLMPVKKLVVLTRQMHPEALILLDGSHAPGNIDIDLTDLDPDFYLGNGNKWLFTCKGAAFLYVKKSAQHLIVPAVVSLEFREVPAPGTHAEAVHAAHTTAQAQSLLPVEVPAFEGNYMYIGTKDYCPYITFLDALAFRESVGGDAAIKRYATDLMWRAGQEVARIWNTEVLNPRTMACTMLNVRLPTEDEQVAKDAQLRLYNEHGVFMMVYSWEGHQWTRLSSQIYLELSDFQEAAQHFLRLVREEEAKRTAAHKAN